mmetsp:Transcript_34649/g.40108  ORF Transcript_34649/g.40108 Transcript_34649/m.40108 type:complete len:151 (+) Transcript_34649:258-710(+)
MTGYDWFQFIGSSCRRCQFPLERHPLDGWSCLNHQQQHIYHEQQQMPLSNQRGSNARPFPDQGSNPSQTSGKHSWYDIHIRTGRISVQELNWMVMATVAVRLSKRITRTADRPSADGWKHTERWRPIRHRGLQFGFIHSMVQCLGWKTPA